MNPTSPALELLNEMLQGLIGQLDEGDKSSFKMWHKEQDYDLVLLGVPNLTSQKIEKICLAISQVRSDMEAQEELYKVENTLSAFRSLLMKV